MRIFDYELTMTCGACPEQYNVFLRGEQVGYIRLRHGVMTVEYPYCGGEVVYCECPRGEGIFEDDERGYYLQQAVIAIAKAINRQKYSNPLIY